MAKGAERERVGSNRLGKHWYTSFLSNDYYVPSWYYKNLYFYLSTAKFNEVWKLRFIFANVGKIVFFHY